MKNFLIFAVSIAAIFAGCKSNESQSADSVEPAGPDVQVLEDTLLQLTTRALALSTGVPVMLPFRGDTTAVVIVAVRHAEKDTVGDDPELTPAGQERALRLANILKDFPLDGIYSTRFVRTLKTAQPAADLQRQSVVIYDHKDTEYFSRLAQNRPGKRFLVVGHSNTIPAIINHLTGKEHFPEIDEKFYGDIFVAAIGGEGKPVKVIRVVY